MLGNRRQNEVAPIDDKAAVAGRDVAAAAAYAAAAAIGLDGRETARQGERGPRRNAQASNRTVQEDESVQRPALVCRDGQHVLEFWLETHVAVVGTALSADVKDAVRTRWGLHEDGTARRGIASVEREARRALAVDKRLLVVRDRCRGGQLEGDAPAATGLIGTVADRLWRAHAVGARTADGRGLDVDGTRRTARRRGGQDAVVRKRTRRLKVDGATARAHRVAGAKRLRLLHAAVELVVAGRAHRRGVAAEGGPWARLVDGKALAFRRDLHARTNRDIAAREHLDAEGLFGRIGGMRPGSRRDRQVSDDVQRRRIRTRSLGIPRLDRHGAGVSILLRPGLDRVAESVLAAVPNQVHTREAAGNENIVRRRRHTSQRPVRRG